MRRTGDMSRSTIFEGHGVKGLLERRLTKHSVVPPSRRLCRDVCQALAFLGPRTGTGGDVVLRE